MWGGTPWAALTYAGFLFDPVNQFTPGPNSNVQNLCTIWCVRQITGDVGPPL